MIFPLTLTEISILLAVIAIVILVTSVFLGVSQEYSSKMHIDKTRLRIVGIGCGIAFLVTIALRFI